MRHIFWKSGMVFSAVLALVVFLASSAMAKDEYGSFQKVLEADGSFAEATADLEKSLAGSKLELIGKMDITVPDNAQKCRTYVLTSPAFNQAALDNNLSSDAISALIMRIGVYEGDGKVNINIANPDALANVYFEGEKSRDA